jgi:glycosyltransferase involved in cell wall biosynthesis
MSVEIDVVVAARDEERHLSTCLRSIARQRNVNVHIIVVNDGSVDKTASIADDMANADDRFTVLHHESAGGLAAARNAGLARAVAPWITFVDGDDFLFPGALACRLSSVAGAPSDVIGAYGDWVSVPERSPALPLRRRAATRPDIWMVTAEKGTPFIASAPILDRNLVQSLGGFDVNCTTAEDADFWQWWLRLAGKTIYTPQLCVGYRLRAGSMTRRDLAGHYRANRKAFASFDSDLGLDVPDGVLGAADAHYRTVLAHLPRAVLAAAQAIASDRVDEANEVLREIDPMVLRMAEPSRLAAQGIAAAKRRVSGTRGSRRSLTQITESSAALIDMLESLASPACPSDKLDEAANWLMERRGR